MKKRTYVALSIVLVIISAGYNIYQNQKTETTLSDLALANVEALANTGEGEVKQLNATARPQMVDMSAQLLVILLIVELTLVLIMMEIVVKQVD